MHHDRANSGGIGAHYSLGQVWRDPPPRHQIVIAAPVGAIAAVIFRVHNTEIPIRANIKAKPLAALLDHLGPADQDR